MERRREIYIKINEISEIVENLKQIKKKQDSLKQLFNEYDALNSQENQVYENWGNYLEDTFSRLDNMRL